VGEADGNATGRAAARIARLVEAPAGQPAVLLRYARAVGATRDEMAAALPDGLRNIGDAILVWANEGQLRLLEAEGLARNAASPKRDRLQRALLRTMQMARGCERTGERCGPACECIEAADEEERRE
jgi:hypothetical protein